MNPGVSAEAFLTGAHDQSPKAVAGDPPGWQSLPVVFGPVQTRRLGWSLGINNVRPKTCSYACAYCQVGATTRARIEREAFRDPAAVTSAVHQRVAACRESGQAVDYATFVPDGEPTLDVHLGESIRSIRTPELRVAVITNASLLWREDVREDLATADWVSIKIDTVTEQTWKRLNRPLGSLDLEVVLAGMRSFSEGFSGYLATETMLVADLNDDETEVRSVADFVRSLQPSHAYLSAPVRPGTEPWARAPLPDVAGRAAEVFAATGTPTTLLRGDQAELGFAASDDAIEGLVAILAVQPMTERAAREHVAESAAGWRRVEQLITEGRIVRAERDGTGYLRIDHRHGAKRQKR